MVWRYIHSRIPGELALPNVQDAEALSRAPGLTIGARQNGAAILPSHTSPNCVASIDRV